MLFDINAEAAARKHIDSSKRVLEEAYQTGVSMLTDMGGQRERLKVRAGAVGREGPACGTPGCA